MTFTELATAVMMTVNLISNTPVTDTPVDQMSIDEIEFEMDSIDAWRRQFSVNYTDTELEPHDVGDFLVYNGSWYGDTDTPEKQVWSDATQVWRVDRRDALRASADRRRELMDALDE